MATLQEEEETTIKSQKRLTYSGKLTVQLSASLNTCRLVSSESAKVVASHVNHDVMKMLGCVDI